MLALTKPSVNSLTPRSSPVEDSIYRLNNVTLTLVQREVDNDYHLLVKDAQGHTMITESPDPGCAKQSRLARQLAAVRSAIKAQIPNVSTTALDPNLTVSVRGVGFYDYVPNYAVGEASNGIELHPLTAMCFGVNCTLPP